METRVGIQIRNINNGIKRYLINSPTAKLADKLTGTNTWLIAYISEQTDKERNVFQKDIEETFGVTRSCVSKVVGLMEKKGLIERARVEHDARLKKLVLRGEASECAPKTKKEAEEVEEKILDGFETEEIDKLREYLGRIMKNVEKNLI